MNQKKTKTVRRPFALEPELWELVDEHTAEGEAWQDTVAKAIEKGLAKPRRRSTTKKTPTRRRR